MRSAVICRIVFGSCFVSVLQCQYPTKNIIFTDWSNFPNRLLFTSNNMSQMFDVPIDSFKN